MQRRPPIHQHPLLSRGVWLSPVILPDGRDVALAVTSRGVLIGREEHDPADWDAVYERLAGALDRADPVPWLKLA